MRHVADSVVLVLIALLIVLFAGDPDISDAIRARIFNCGP